MSAPIRPVSPVHPGGGSSEAAQTPGGDLLVGEVVAILGWTHETGLHPQQPPYQTAVLKTPQHLLGPIGAGHGIPLSRVESANGHEGLHWEDR
jgi:hypothetical protein